MTVDRSNPVVLADLAQGARGQVKQVVGERSVRRRLMELGVTPGAEVMVKGVSPLGDPLELMVRGCHLSIRHAEARCVELER